MNILHPNCAGMDVHKKTVVASHRVQQADGTDETVTRTFSTLTSGLLALSEWLLASGATHVAMESTGEYWKPVYNILEGVYDPSCLMVVNSAHIKNVPHQERARPQDRRQGRRVAGRATRQRSCEGKLCTASAAETTARSDTAPAQLHP